jgi:hypothetical protein
MGVAVDSGGVCIRSSFCCADAVYWSMTLIIAVLLAVLQQDGYVSRYDPGVFEQVIQTRIAKGYGFVPQDWREFDGYFAGLDCAAVGREVWARPGVGHRWERLLIADCSGHASTTAWFRRNGVVGEVDYETYTRWRDAGYWAESGMPVQLRGRRWFYRWLG